MQVTAFVAEFGRDGELPGGGLGCGGGGNEDALPETQRVVADVPWGGGQFQVEVADPVFDWEGEVGSVIGLDAFGGHG